MLPKTNSSQAFVALASWATNADQQPVPSLQDMKPTLVNQSGKQAQSTPDAKTSDDDYASLFSDDVENVEAKTPTESFKQAQLTQDKEMSDVEESDDCDSLFGDGP